MSAHYREMQALRAQIERMARWHAKYDEREEREAQYKRDAERRQLRRPERVVCGARCRDGHACRAKSVPGKRRCRMHGGLSTGPRTAEGKERIAESNRRRAQQRASGQT